MDPVPDWPHMPRKRFRPPLLPLAFGRGGEEDREGGRGGADIAAGADGDAGELTSAMGESTIFQPSTVARLLLVDL